MAAYMCCRKIRSYSTINSFNFALNTLKSDIIKTVDQSIIPVLKICRNASSSSSNGPSKTNNISSSVHAGSLSNENDQPSASQSSFDLMIQTHKDEASRSIFVGTDKPNLAQLTKYCNQFGRIQNITACEKINGKVNALVLYEEKESALNVLKETRYAAPIEAIIPVQSRFLSFNCKSSNDQRKQEPEVDIEWYSEPTQLKVFGEMQSCKTVEQQMQIFHQRYKMSLFGKRLRYLVALQIEEAFSGLIPHLQAAIFGSGNNGFGTYCSDLDINLNFGEDSLTLAKSQGMTFLTKSTLASDRMNSQEYLQFISDMIQYFIPGPRNLVRIFRARVPIVKFFHEFTGLDCDISTQNQMSPSFMTELLYLYSETDPRVAPLSYVIKNWGKEELGIGSDQNRQAGISNFNLLLMILFYLQVCDSKAVLPSVQQLNKLAGPLDKRECGEVICRFVRDLDKFPKTENTMSAEDLLHGFFHFYSSFDFGNNALSLIYGEELKRQRNELIRYAAMHIENPIEPDLNTTTNVNREKVGQFKNMCMQAMLKLDSAQKPIPGKGWGLLKLFEKSSGKSHSVSSGSDHNMKKTVNLSEVMSKDADFEITVDKVLPKKKPGKRKLNEKNR